MPDIWLKYKVCTDTLYKWINVCVGGCKKPVPRRVVD